MTGLVADTWSGASYERIAETFAPIHDLTPDQLAKARRAAAEEGLAIRFDEGDCQELPYENAEFDSVASCFGAIFAADHGRAGGELDEWSEVNERAGRTSPPGADARDWAREEHVRGLLGGAFDLELETGEWRIEADSGAELWELVSTSMPPLRAWLAEPGDKVRARAERVYLDHLASGVLARRYLLVLGTRR